MKTIMLDKHNTLEYDETKFTQVEAVEAAYSRGMISHPMMVDGVEAAFSYGAISYEDLAEVLRRCNATESLTYQAA